MADKLVKPSFRVMLFARGTLLTALLALAGCAPAADTGNPDVDAIVDLVVSREGPFHSCIAVTSPSGLVAEFPSDYPLPNGGGWDVNQFEDARTVEAARRIAVSLDEATRMEQEIKALHFLGKPVQNTQGCALSLSYPTFSGNFAFLSFMSPGGALGTYALERHGSRWRVKERVHWGAW